MAPWCLGRTCPAEGTALVDRTYHVVETRHIRAHTVWLRFHDGTSGEIDLAPALHGPVMTPLKDVTFFKQFAIHAEFHTLVWPNGADFAPEFLHDNVQVTA